METIQPKKLLILYILDILRRYTDAEHTLTQNEIVEILAKEYNMKADRKSVKRNLMNLAEMDFNIQYDEIERTNTTVKDGKKITVEETICTDWYIERDFSDSELRLLIDGLLFSHHISNSQCRELIGKLEGLSNKYFKSKVKHVAIPPVDKTDNRQLFYTVDVLDEAISKGKKVSFYYCEYGVDKKLHRRKRSDGTDREYICSPYQMAVNDGKYFLICNYDKYSDIANYRLDRIKDIKILDEDIKPFEVLVGSDGQKLDLKKYMSEHIYMFSSENINVKFSIPKTNYFLTDIIDKFGTGVKITEKEECYIIDTKVNKAAMHQFAKAYVPFVTILSPQSLVDEMKSDLTQALDNYEKGE